MTHANAAVLSSARMRLVACMLLAALVGSAAPLHAQEAAPSTPVMVPNARQLELRDIDSQLASSSRLAPTLVLGLGVTGLVTAASVGFGRAISCDGACSVPAWVGVMLVAGAALSATGLIGLLRVNHDITQLELKKSMLEQELEASRRHSALERRELALHAGASTLTLHFVL